MSWSVSSPLRSTNTSPCSVGFMVPASTFKYGSTFTRLTGYPFCCRRRPIELVTTPLPTPLMTPPRTKIYLCPSLAMLDVQILTDSEHRGDSAEHDAREEEYEENDAEVVGIIIRHAESAEPARCLRPRIPGRGPQEE